MLQREALPAGLPEVPKLALPEVLAGIWQPRRYKVMHGGRGGG